MTQATMPGMLRTNRRAVDDLTLVLARLAPYAGAITLWVPGDQFAAWAYVIGAKVMHTMRNTKTNSAFAWVTNDATGDNLRVAVHTHDSPAPWVTFPPRGAEDTKRFVLKFGIDENRK